MKGGIYRALNQLFPSLPPVLHPPIDFDYFFYLLNPEVNKVKKILQNERAFTLIEMLIVLMIISVLLMIIIPNMTKNNEVASNKGCEATIKLLQAQVHAYELENNKEIEKLDDLTGDGGFVEKISCPDGTDLKYDPKSKRVIHPSSNEPSNE
ncbi:prepilin-type N-terminal cleavage/methylation domain-containing protein [bacterium LRH843]|nr:prepilin-type N-terminal cleavage/methylation domain-containing protein [bacterium LRH843]